MNNQLPIENERLSALYELNILDTEKEERFDRITQFIAQIFHIPICAIGLIADNRIWFKSKVGIEVSEIPLNDSSFEKVIMNNSTPLIVQNAKSHEKYSNNYLVINRPSIQTFAGVPLYSDSRLVIGVLFIADISPHLFTQDTSDSLSTLSKWVENELGLSKPQQDKSSTETQEELNIKNNALQVINAQNEAVLGSIGDGVVVINDKGEITFVNKQAEGLLGWKHDELIGKIIFHALRLEKDNGEEVLITEYPIRNAIYARQKTTNNIFSYVRKDGNKFAAATTATPIMIAEAVIGGVTVFRDISKERDIDRMKTEFISLASHQLRTPLSAIKWFTEMLIDGDVGAITDEQKEIVNNVYQSNERMIELVNTLLNISRIESGRIIIEPKLTNLKKLVDEVVVELQPKIVAKKHSLVISLHENLPDVMIDQKLVRHVYMNLLTNAIKYTSENGQIMVIISKAGEEIVSQVTDNGYGIPEEQKEKVFSKFFRAKNIVGVETDGTGLGLYLTKAIVESSGGRIWFESIIKKDDPTQTSHGTTFWFTLPLSGMVPKKGEVTIDS